MKIVCLYSPSHKEMYEKYFLPSFPKDSRLELKTVEAPQLAGDKPVFNDSNWKNFMHIKAKVLYDELLSIPENEVYGFIDVDVICVNNFYDYVMDVISSVDYVCQSDAPAYFNILNHCTGVIFFKNNENCRNLLKAVNKYLDSFNNEQEALSFFALNHKNYEELQNLKYLTFPFSRAFTYGSFFGKVWSGEDFKLPSKDELLWVHANWTPHERKVELLDKFKEKLNE